MEPAIKEIFDKLYLYRDSLTVGQREYIDSIKKYYKKYHSLSDKQLAVLQDIKKYLVTPMQRYTMRVN